MNCFYHNEKDASFVCVECKKSICNECAVNNNGDIMCKECVEKMGLPIVKNEGANNYRAEESKNNRSYNQYGNTNINSYNKRRISRFWATAFSLMPGAGHMYLGIMKRGLQIMVAFFAIIAIANIFHSAGFLTPFSIIVWFYSIFDCYHIRKKLQNGEEVDDDLVIDMKLGNINIYHVGIGLVVFGGLILASEVLSELSFIYDRINLSYYVIRFLRNALFPLALIFIGILMLKKSREGKEA